MDKIIKFDQPFCKLYGQKQAKLIYKRPIKKIELIDQFINYDTKYFNKKTNLNYNILGDDFILLVFIGNKNIPFTTLRKNTEENNKKYVINEWFYIKINNNGVL